MSSKQKSKSAIEKNEATFVHGLMIGYDGHQYHPINLQLSLCVVSWKHQTQGLTEEGCVITEEIPGFGQFVRARGRARPRVTPQLV